MGHGRGRRNLGDWCEKFARGLVIGVNIIFFLLGLAIVITGAVLAKDAQTIQNSASLTQAILNDLNVVVIALILVVCGGCIVLTSLCGVIGALKTWRKCLVFYAATMFLLLCIQFAMGFYLNSLQPSALEARWHSATPKTRYDIQNFLQCCGWSSVTDTAPYPDCIYDSFQPPAETCQVAAYAYINSHIKPIALTAIILAAFEFMSMFATCGLIYSSKDLKPGDDFFD